MRKVAADTVKCASSAANCVAAACLVGGRAVYPPAVRRVVNAVIVAVIPAHGRKQLGTATTPLTPVFVCEFHTMRKSTLAKVR